MIHPLCARIFSSNMKRNNGSIWGSLTIVDAQHKTIVCSLGLWKAFAGKIQNPLTKSRRVERRKKKTNQIENNNNNTNNKLLTPNSENKWKWMDNSRVRDEYCLPVRRNESIEMKLEMRVNESMASEKTHWKININSKKKKPERNPPTEMQTEYIHTHTHTKSVHVFFLSISLSPSLLWQGIRWFEIDSDTTRHEWSVHMFARPIRSCCGTFCRIANTLFISPNSVERILIVCCCWLLLWIPNPCDIHIYIVRTYWHAAAQQCTCINVSMNI